MSTVGFDIALQSSDTDYAMWHISCMCMLFVGFVPGTTSVRKAHQIPVDSLVSYLQKELGLHQGGNIKNCSMHVIDSLEHCVIFSLEIYFCHLFWLLVKETCTTTSSLQHITRVIFLSYIYHTRCRIQLICNITYYAVGDCATILTVYKAMYENASKIALNASCRKLFK